MPIDLNEDGQPTERALGWKRLADSRFDELIGICRGILADGVLVIEDARFLRDWLERNPQVRFRDEGKQLYNLLVSALRDGTLDDRVETELVDCLAKIIGGTPRSKADASSSTTFPLDDPAPAIVFPAKGFCLTGKFIFGTRKACEAAVTKVGGLVHSSPNLETNFLVIGEIGSAQWAHSSSGRKIERAQELRGSGSGIAIVCEAIWCAAIKKCN